MPVRSSLANFCTDRRGGGGGPRGRGAGPRAYPGGRAEVFASRAEPRSGRRARS